MTAPVGGGDAIDPARLQALEEKFDPEMRFRPTLPPATAVVTGLLIALSLFHYYTAGFGLLRETTHRGVHMAFVLGLVFVVFPRRRPRAGDPPIRSSWLAPGGVPLVDWLLGGGSTGYAKEARASRRSPTVPATSLSSW